MWAEILSPVEVGQCFLFFGDDQASQHRHLSLPICNATCSQSYAARHQPSNHYPQPSFFVSLFSFLK
jgi:hypothetical protein